jgi:hypothetical protein
MGCWEAWKGTNRSADAELISLWEPQLRLDQQNKYRCALHVRAM